MSASARVEVHDGTKSLRLCRVRRWLTVPLLAAMLWVWRKTCAIGFSSGLPDGRYTKRAPVAPLIALGALANCSSVSTALIQKAT